MDDDRMRYFNGTGWLAIFTGTETMIGRTVDVDAWDEATGVALVVDPQGGSRRPVTDFESLTGHDVEGPHRSRWGPSSLPSALVVLVFVYLHS